MNPVAVVAKVFRLLKDKGLRESLDVLSKNVRLKCWKYANTRFDWMHGTDTGGTIERTELQIDSPSVNQGVRYEPTP